MFWRKANPNKGKKVYVGLSGGVDSGVSAALLKQQGYNVVGAFIKISLEGYPCSAPQDKLDAQRVAAHLKIPFIEIDLSDAYRQRVFELSMEEFDAGRTPNPDALCNREIKFGIFYDWCMEQGADFVATGHYSRLRNTGAQQEQVETSIAQRDGASIANSQQGIMRARQDFVPVELLSGKDTNKDQSYFLWAVPQAKLAKTIFPIGHLTKPEVRALAAQFNLPNAGRPDSQGLCFLGDISIDDMLHRELTLVPGDVVDESGEVIGRHEGVQAYTIGQRHGFELFAHGPHTKPHYVIGKDAEFNTITVSTEKYPQHAAATEVELSDCNWIGDTPSGDLTARFRYRGQCIPATLDAARTKAVLKQPQYVPEGQSLVFYSGERCIGGGIISRAWLSSSPNPTVLSSRSTNAS